MEIFLNQEGAIYKKYEVAIMEETKNATKIGTNKKKEQQVNPSYVGSKLTDELYLEIGMLPDGMKVRLQDQNRNIIAEFDYEQFNKKVKTLRSTAKRLAQV